MRWLPTNAINELRWKKKILIIIFLSDTQIQYEEYSLAIDSLQTFNQKYISLRISFSEYLLVTNACKIYKALFIKR